MSVEHKVFYSAQYIGVVSPTLYNLLGHFFENQGMQRVASRLDQLPDLKTPLLEDAWRDYLQAVSATLSDDYLKLHFCLGNSVLITDQEMGKNAIKEIQLPNALVVKNYPDNIKILELYRYRLSPQRIDNAIVQPNSRFQSILDDQTQREIFTSDIQTALGQPDKPVMLPPSNSAHINLVVASRFSRGKKEVQMLKALYQNVITLRIPSVQGLGRFMLGMSEGEMNPENWQDYFMPVQRPEAKTLFAH